jgi:HAD superfamily hydrolase (TIGR01509 family)
MPEADAARARLRRVEGVVFDLDGTLLALKQRPGGGLARRLWVLTETPMNYGMLALTRLRLEPALRGAIDQARRLKGIARHEELAAIAGAVDAVAALASRYAIAVVTNRGRRDALGFLERAGLATHARVVVTRDDVWRLKPHPAPLRRAALALGLPAERTVLVGDMPVDMRAARRAGALAIGVTSGFCTATELLHAGADRVLASVCELPGLLELPAATIT